MSVAMDFHSQIASIMEVLANAAVAEICKVVDDGYAVVQLEVSRSQKENEFLRRKMKLLELQLAKYRAERVKGAEGSRFSGVRLLNRHNKDFVTGSSLQGRTRYLNRGPGAQPATKRVQLGKLAQDPDQEVVTTTKTEGQGCVTGTSSPLRAEAKLEEAEGDTLGKDGPCLKQQASQVPTQSAIRPQDRYQVAQTTANPRDQAADELTAVRSQQPLLCLQVNESPTDMMFEGNTVHSNMATFNGPPVVTGSVNFQFQQKQLAWSGNKQMDNLSGQHHLYDAPSGQTQKRGLDQAQQRQMPSLPFACTLCSRSYAHLCHLRIHQRVHTGEKPHQCTQCGKSFGQFCSLKRHQMVHTGERPFPCPHCGKQFSTSTNLKVHQSVHTGEKKFHCSKCGKNFSFLSNLIRHQALHTSKGKDDVNQPQTSVFLDAQSR